MTRVEWRQEGSEIIITVERAGEPRSVKRFAADDPAWAEEWRTLMNEFYNG